MTQLGPDDLPSVLIGLSPNRTCHVLTIGTKWCEAVELALGLKAGNLFVSRLWIGVRQAVG
jgi:hypothetical protein